MPKVAIFPDATISNGWTIVGTGTADVVLLDNEFSNYLETNTNTEYFEMRLGALDSVGLNIDTITSIQVHMWSDHDTRGASSTVTCDYRNSSGIINSYSEDIALSTTGAIHDTPFTARTTSDGSDLWEDDDIEDMRFRVTMDTVDTGGAYTIISQMYLTVTYTEVVIPIITYSSDDNVILKNGLTELKNGLIIIK